MKSLFQQIESVENVSICGRTNRLYLLGVLPKAIANKADVSNEFCGGKEDSFEWLTDASTQYYNKSVATIQIIYNNEYLYNTDQNLHNYVCIIHSSSHLSSLCK